MMKIRNRAKRTMNTRKKNSRGQKFTCAHCGRNFQNAQGLSGHIRYQHPDRKLSVKTGEGRHDLEVKASSPAADTGAHGHLQAAFAMLSQRDREIAEEIARLQSLTAEKEIVRRELDAVNAALKVLAERESGAHTEIPGEPGKSAPLDTQDALLRAKENISLSGPSQTSEANTVPDSAASGNTVQPSLARKAKPAANGKLNGKAPNTRAGKAPEFTGNKTEFVRAVVQFRGAAGATPKDIDQVFAQRRIEKSKNAIYNALDSLVRQNKLKKKDGQYFYLEGPGR